MVVSLFFSYIFEHLLLIGSFRHNRKHHARQSNASLGLKDCFTRQIQCSDVEILSYLAKDLPKPPVRSLNERIRSLLKEPEIPLSATPVDEPSDSDCTDSEPKLSSDSSDLYSESSSDAE